MCNSAEQRCAMVVIPRDRLQREGRSRMSSWPSCSLASDGTIIAGTLEKAGSLPTDSAARSIYEPRTAGSRCAAGATKQSREHCRLLRRFSDSRFKTTSRAEVASACSCRQVCIVKILRGDRRAHRAGDAHHRIGPAGEVVQATHLARFARESARKLRVHRLGERAVSHVPPTVLSRSQR